MQTVQATEPDLIEVRSLFWEYLQWANANLKQAFGVSFDIAAMLEGDMAGIHKFYPPHGRLLLARVDGAAGRLCLYADAGRGCRRAQAHLCAPHTAAEESVAPCAGPD